MMLVFFSWSFVSLNLRFNGSFVSLLNLRHICCSFVFIVPRVVRNINWSFMVVLMVMWG